MKVQKLLKGEFGTRTACAVNDREYGNNYGDAQQEILFIKKTTGVYHRYRLYGDCAAFARLRLLSDFNLPGTVTPGPHGWD